MQGVGGGRAKKKGLDTDGPRRAPDRMGAHLTTISLSRDSRDFSWHPALGCEMDRPLLAVGSPSLLWSDHAAIICSPRQGPMFKKTTFGITYTRSVLVQTQCNKLHVTFSLQKCVKLQPRWRIAFASVFCFQRCTLNFWKLLKLSKRFGVNHPYSKSKTKKGRKKPGIIK